MFHQAYRLVALLAVAATSYLSTLDARAESLIDYWEVSGNVNFETRSFVDPGEHPGQRRQSYGFVFQPELYLEDAEGRSLTFEVFHREDSMDPERTHFDVQKAYLLLYGDLGDGEWELRVGNDRVYWGVAESRQLVDIINQVDFVENPNEKSKLGQPMAHATLSGDWGIVELFAMPWHRKRTQPGLHGRFRSPLVIDNDFALYESRNGPDHMDYAARYSQSFGIFDVGLSYFDGTSREPAFVPMLNTQGLPFLAPYYDQIRQFGLDVQVTTGSWLLKLESIHRSGATNVVGKKEDYTAVVTGGEYTLGGVFETDIDISLIGEWNWDERGIRAPNGFQSDLFAGMRVGFNDIDNTDLIVGVLQDTELNSRTITAEFNRRLTDEVSIHLEGLYFQEVDARDISYGSRGDSFVEMHLIYNF